MNVYVLWEGQTYSMESPSIIDIYSSFESAKKGGLLAIEQYDKLCKESFDWKCELKNNGHYEFANKEGHFFSIEEFKLVD